MRNKVIIFEGANFLGCVLIEKLLQHGFQVIAVDSLPHAEQEFFARFKDVPEFTCAMSTPDVKEGEVRAVYYFGLQLCHARNKVFFLQMLDLNNSLARKAITLAEKTKAVYVGLSLRDTSHIPGVASCRYMLFPEAWQKANVYAEALARQSREGNGTDVRLVRIFNCYGENMGNTAPPPLPSSSRTPSPEIPFGSLTAARTRMPSSSPMTSRSSCCNFPTQTPGCFSTSCAKRPSHSQTWHTKSSPSAMAANSFHLPHIPMTRRTNSRRTSRIHALSSADF